MKSGNFHESYGAGAVAPPSERSTGLLFAVVSVIVAILWRNSPIVLWLALSLAATLTVISLFAAGLLKPLNILWFKFGLLLHRVVNPVVMFVIFAVAFVPMGMLMRLWRDPLRSQRKPAASSYWIERKDSAGSAQSMTNQF